MANSGEARVVAELACVSGAAAAVLRLAKWRGKWGARRGRAGEGERVEWRGPPGCHPYAVASERQPRGGRVLLQQAVLARELARASGPGVGQAGPACRLGREAWREAH